MKSKKYLSNKIKELNDIILYHVNDMIDDITLNWFKYFIWILFLFIIIGYVYFSQISIFKQNPLEYFVFLILYTYFIDIIFWNNEPWYINFIKRFISFFFLASFIGFFILFLFFFLFW